MMEDRDNTINLDGEDNAKEDLQHKNFKPEDLTQQDTGQDTATEPQKMNIIEQIMDLEHKASDPKYRTFKKSTYWHRLTPDEESSDIQAALKDVTEYLLRIETSLTAIEALLKQYLT